MMGEPFHILLVEDNPADVYLLRMALEEAGVNCNLTVIEDGASAIALVQTRASEPGPPPDLAVIDLSLPKNDGVEILEVIRATERFSDIPVAVFSSSTSPPPGLNLDSLRIARYIVKPSELEQFLKIGVTLREILLESRQRRTKP